jgi:outer membrane biosynthesis protein TonB
MAKKKKVPVAKKAKPKPKAKPKLKAASKPAVKAKPRAKAVAKQKAKPKVSAKRKKVAPPKPVVVEAPDSLVEVVSEVIVVEISYDAIARRAYEIWESKGRPEGDGSDNWAEAEAQLRAETRFIENNPID